MTPDQRGKAEKDLRDAARELERKKQASCRTTRTPSATKR